MGVHAASRAHVGGRSASTTAAAQQNPAPYGDQHYHSEIRRLILDALTEHQVIAIPSQSPKWTEPHVLPEPPSEFQQALIQRDIEECEDAQPRWDAVWKDAVAARDLVDPDRRDYYQAAVLTMILINRESNRALLEVARAIEDEQAGDPLKADLEINEALGSLGAVQAIHGRGRVRQVEELVSRRLAYRRVSHARAGADYANHLKDPMAKLPAPAAWTGWEAYFHIMEYEDDRSVDVR